MSGQKLTKGYALAGYRFTNQLRELEQKSEGSSWALSHHLAAAAPSEGWTLKQTHKHRE